MDRHPKHAARAPGGVGFETVVATDGEECLSVARSQLPDLVILDLMLPKLHGLEVLKRLKSGERTRHIGVIVCSAKDFKTEVDQARDLGAFEFLPRPVPEQDLLTAVRRFLASRSGAELEDVTDGSRCEAVAEIYRPEARVVDGSIRFWGTRGSTPVSGPESVRHGGNTSCIAIAHGGECVLIDAGSGSRNAGLALVGEGPRELHLFITHTHWDHIQGFPFFVPAYVPGYDITIYASRNVEKDIESIFRGQLDRAYFPVQMEDMKAQFTFKELGDEPIRIGDPATTWAYSVHPGAAVGYKVEMARKKFAYFTDNEFSKGYLGDPRGITAESQLVAMHREQLDFVRGVDLLIHEAQYTNEEYAGKIGWGHSSLANACALVKLAGVDRWIIPHHDPDHADDFLQQKLNLTRQILRDLDCHVEVTHAYDGMVEYL